MNPLHLLWIVPVVFLSGWFLREMIETGKAAAQRLKMKKKIEKPIYDPTLEF